ncbi:MAG: hypothetical protein C0604_06000 [Clostridiales bacterium]|nr:MAG: hypothetical protein C0604_06000 [Clostridiales bacterium]
MVRREQKTLFDKGDKMKKILGVMFAGLGAVLPITITVYILYKLFIIIDSVFADFVTRIIGYRVLGIGFLMTVAIVFLIGLVAKAYLGQKLIKMADRIFNKIPVAQTIYGTVREISNSLLLKEKITFKRPVLVDYPKPGVQAIGFITNERSISKDGTMLPVFIPTTPNPTSGFLLFYKRDELQYLDMTVDEAIKIIISVGVVIPDKIKKDKLEM